MKRVTLGVCLLTLISFSVAADVENGRKLANKCIACHGDRGIVSIPMYPNLAGQNALYLENSMKAYNTGERTGMQAEIMKAYLNGLSDQDIADLAEYYAGLKAE